MISRELIAASTKPLVLGILGRQESYGYELIQYIKELSGGRIEWSEGMLYPYLHWMEDEGLIDSEWKTSSNGRKRKYYRLSRAGGKAVKLERDQWLAVQETLGKLWKSPIHST